MKRLIIGLIILAAVAGGGYLLANPGVLGAAMAKKPEAAPVLPAAKASDRVVSEGKVVPVRTAALSLSGGTVAEVLVAEGDRVQAGQVLVKLDSARQAAAVAQAEAGLLRAEARLLELQAGPRPAEIEVAQAAIEGARAQLAQVQQGVRPEEITAAEAAVAAAQAGLDKAMEGPDEKQIIAARAEVENAAATLRHAQAAYDQVVWRTDIEARPESAQLHQATNNHAAAQARLEVLMKDPSASSIANARAQVEQAQARLDGLKAPARSAEVAAAVAEIRRAEAQLNLVQTGVRPETVAAAEADIATARAALQQAKIAQAETELKAPFAGTVAAVDAEPGEQVGPSTPIVRLADLSSWQVETTDLTELSIARVRAGSSVTVTLDALPGVELTGKVTRIRPIGQSNRGDINYTVVVNPDQMDERLRWNMTASVSIGQE